MVMISSQFIDIEPLLGTPWLLGRDNFEYCLYFASACKRKSARRGRTATTVSQHVIALGQPCRKLCREFVASWQRRRTRKRAILRLSLVSPCGCWTGSCLTFLPDATGQGASPAVDPDGEGGRALKSPSGLTASGHQAGWCGTITLTGGCSILVALGEIEDRSRVARPTSLRAKRGARARVIVGSNARIRKGLPMRPARDKRRESAFPGPHALGFSR